MIVMQDKRDNPRLNICLSSSIRKEDEDKRAFSIVKNISSTGIYLTTRKQYDVGSITDCIVSMDDGAISFKGEIVRNLMEDDNYGYGIQITEIDDKDDEKLNRFIENGFYTIMNEMNEDTKVEQACQESVVNYSEIGNYDGIYSPEAEYIASDGIDSRLLQAAFPFRATVEEYDFSYQNDEVKHQIEDIQKLDWVESSKNVIFFGPSGCGKTHLAVGLAIKALERDYKVSFTTLKDLLNIIRTERVLQNSKYRMSKILESRVIVIDEVGAVPLSKEESNAFFQFVNKIYGKASLVMTSDLTFEQWKESIGDNAAVDLLLDRMAYNIGLKGLVN